MNPAPEPPPHAVWAALASIDVYGEWVDARAHPQLARLIAFGHDGRPLGDYLDSVSALRGGRRESPPESAEFWRAPASRAHLLNAVLRRGSRTLVTVERDLDIRTNKLHSYFASFGVRFTARQQREALVIDYHGESYDAEITREPQPGQAYLRVHGFPDEALGVWSPHSRAYRLLQPLPQPQGVIPLAAAGRLLRVQRGTLSRALDLAGVRCNGRVYLAHLVRLFPDTQPWLEAAKDAYARELDA